MLSLDPIYCEWGQSRDTDRPATGPALQMGDFRGEQARDAEGSLLR